MRGLSKHKIAVIGLGYVGLPLAVEFGKKYRTVGFDINRCAHQGAESGARRHTGDDQCGARGDAQAAVLGADQGSQVLQRLHRDGADAHRSIQAPGPDAAAQAPARRSAASSRRATSSSTNPPSIRAAPRKFACRCWSAFSSLRFNKEFYCGYSPERINPGDKQHRLATIKKVTSGSMPRIADLVNALYASIITAGTHQASSIKVAEAAKVIENTQRDVNIALINELALIFKRIGIDTEEVLRAAGTKWNFLPFRPGLVGGHCIGVDPYYLTHKATEIGYHPEMILAGRRINDGMGAYVAQQTRQAHDRTAHHGGGLEDPDSRACLQGELSRSAQQQGHGYRQRAADASMPSVDVYDPWVDADGAYREYGLRPVKAPKPAGYDAIVLAVGHDEFKAMGARKIRPLGEEDSRALRRQVPVCRRSDRRAAVVSYEDFGHRRRRIHRIFRVARVAGARR